jgi:uncharacterized phage-associated protein
MAEVRDVAQHILDKVGPTSTWKLQKLVYYAQAWHSVWEDAPLFSSRIEAWANGPVCRELYDLHKGEFSIKSIPGGDGSRLTKKERSSVDAVAKFYNKYNGQQLSDLTHGERPWIEARSGLSPNERGDREIAVERLAEYYSTL